MSTAETTYPVVSSSQLAYGRVDGTYAVERLRIFAIIMGAGDLWRMLRHNLPLCQAQETSSSSIDATLAVLMRPTGVRESQRSCS